MPPKYGNSSSFIFSTNKKSDDMEILIIFVLVLAFIGVIAGLLRAGCGCLSFIVLAIIALAVLGLLASHK